MVLNRQKKIENAVVYFAWTYKNHFGCWPKQMWIYKLLALLDFNVLKATGIPCLGLDYLALKHGPVPSVLYDLRREKLPFSGFRMKEVWYDTFEVEALQYPDLSVFSDTAVEEMKRLSETFILSADKASIHNPEPLNKLIEETHKLNSWKQARIISANTGNGRIIMDTADEFPKDILNKDPIELTWAEEVFANNKLKELAELRDAE